jgi:signal transduction histidine kinase
LGQLIECAPVAVCIAREDDLVVELANVTCRERMHEPRPAGRRLDELLPPYGHALESAEAQQALRRGELWIFREGASDGGVTWTWLAWRLLLRSRSPLLIVFGYAGSAESAELESARRALAHEQDVIRAKHDLIARLLHELRGPLAPINAALEIMRGQEPARRERAWTILNRQFKYLVRLIDDMSELNRNSRTGLSIHRERVELGSIVEQAVELATPMLSARRHALQLDVARDIFVEGDAGRLVQVVANLLTNAAKYTQDGGSICVSARRVATDAVLCVRDDGIGISSEVLPHVFDMFVRAPRAQHLRDGLGIGLYIVRTLVSEHGGTVEARSAGPGLGSEFIVRLPARER